MRAVREVARCDLARRFPRVSLRSAAHALAGQIEAANAAAAARGDAEAAYVARDVARTMSRCRPVVNRLAGALAKKRREPVRFGSR